MKPLLAHFAAYHLWANGLLADRIRALPQALKTEPVAASFPGLHATLLHMWDAESIWWQRIKLLEPVARPSETFTGDTDAVILELLKQSRQWADWVNSATERMLEHQFIYRNAKGERFKQPVHQVLLQVFNHGTYHRGQLVAMLRQLNVSPVPQTDFIAWSRMRAKG